MKSNNTILILIVLAQFCCTSLWFASNSVMDELALVFNLSTNALGHLTSSVQFGFICGTLAFAIYSIADRFSPSKVFFASAILGAVSNGLIIIDHQTFTSLMILRFCTGFFLAGVYPVGMKIASDYFDKRLDRSLGFLVGALVLGTSFPHFISAIGSDINWKEVILTASVLSVIGGLSLLLFVPDGPYRKPAADIDFSIVSSMFKERKFRSAAFGYFGHMWELYAFWTFVPVMLISYSTTINVSFWSFIIIGIGSLSCILGGYLSSYFGEKKVASIALGLSGLCCIISSWFFDMNDILFLIFLIFWGIVVIMDSPLFSTLVARNADAEYKATALTIVNCIGFAITILSIQLLGSLMGRFPVKYILSILAVGPILGLIGLWKR